LGGNAEAAQASIGKIIGPAVEPELLPEMIDRITSLYLEHRHQDESFFNAYQRLGHQVFKEAAYQQAQAS